MSEGLQAGVTHSTLSTWTGDVIPCCCDDDQDFVPCQHGKRNLAQAKSSVGKAFRGFPGFAADKNDHPLENHHDGDNLFLLKVRVSICILQMPKPLGPAPLVNLGAPSTGWGIASRF